MIICSSQVLPHSSTPTGNKIVPNVGTIEFPNFFTQMALDGMRAVHEATPNAEDSTHASWKSTKYTNEQNLVLLSRCIKYGTNCIVGRNQKGESYYENAKCIQQSGWLEHDVLAKTHELYSSANNGNFNLMKQFLAVNYQPC